MYLHTGLNKDYGIGDISNKGIDDIILSYIHDMDVHRMGLVIRDQKGLYHSPGSDNLEIHSREALHMEQVLGRYLCSRDGEDFVRYVTNQRGKEFVEIKGIGAGDLGESTVAAILMNDTEGILLANYNGLPFEERVSQMARQYNVSNDSLRNYVITHELAHAAGNRTEESCEGFVKEFYQHQAENAATLEKKTEYLSLANIAENREKQAKEANQ